MEGLEGMEAVEWWMGWRVEGVDGMRWRGGWVRSGGGDG